MYQANQCLWGFIPLYVCLFMWWNVDPGWDLSAWQPWFKLSLPCTKRNKCFKNHLHSICTQACFQCYFHTIIPHLYLESAVTLLLFQFYPANLADGASLLFGNCTMAGSKGWPKHVGWFGWLNCCISSITAINIHRLCVGLGAGEGTGELSWVSVSREQSGLCCGLPLGHLTLQLFCILLLLLKKVMNLQCVLCFWGELFCQSLGFGFHSWLHLAVVTKLLWKKTCNTTAADFPAAKLSRDGICL